ncbi:MAG: hypothetical protein SAK29_43210 [Scytonema sp. PMC 1069.18]|nr:hypothetical protein [Scytonema sp. PMC 1069.18]MEC4885130.1 hypothetical protein [Scytonema sp. PMC 1070.18]
MRAAISLFIASLLLSSFAISSQLPNLFLSKTDSSQLLATKPKKPKTTPPKSPKPNPWRGSGRRDLMEYMSSTSPAV